MKMQWNATGMGEDREAPGPAVDSVHLRRCDRDEPLQLPKMRAPVSTWTIARIAAAVANQALNAIGVENTEVTMSV